jgi:hypothetical protein
MEHRLGSDRRGPRFAVILVGASLWFTGDGVIQAAQLLKASGFPLVNQACLQAALGRRFEGLPEGHSDGRTYFSILWVFQPKQGDVPQPVKIKWDPSIPRLPAGGAMHPLPKYPADALAQGAHGICKMQIDYPRRERCRLLR